jgi:hypothetical protein
MAERSGRERWFGVRIAQLGEFSWATKAAKNEVKESRLTD